MKLEIGLCSTFQIFEYTNSDSELEFIMNGSILSHVISNRSSSRLRRKEGSKAPTLSSRKPSTAFKRKKKEQVLSQSRSVGKDPP